MNLKDFMVSTIEIIRSILKEIVDSWFVFITFIGVIAIVVSSSYALDSDVIQNIGVVLITSGTFASLTRYISVKGFIKKELIAILTDKQSPLVHSHVNMLGRYSFILNELIELGQLRPLNPLNIKDYYP